jgi:hypothetical protein
MLKPYAGLQAFHEGKPYEFLHLIGRALRIENWRVRPIFVNEPDRDLLIADGDRLSPIHSNPRKS